MMSPAIKPIALPTTHKGLGTLKPLQITDDIPGLINQKLPIQLIQKKPMGGNKPPLSYISGATVTDILNAAFGQFGWSSTILEQWMEPGIPFVNKYNNNALEEQNPIAFVKIRLEVSLADEHGNIVKCHKEAFGSKSIVGKQSEQESSFKAAQTDALKKAASLFGIGLELYRKEEEAQYFQELNIKPTWSEENISKYRKEYEYIMQIAEANSEYVDQCVAFITEGVVSSFDYIPLDKVKTLRDMIMEAFAESEGE